MSAALAGRLAALERRHSQPMVEVWLADPVEPAWSVCQQTGERVPSAELDRRGVIEVMLDVALDRRPDA